MAKYAILDSNNKVLNIIAIEPELAKDWFPDAILYTDENPACLNGVYNPETKTFTRPIESNNETTIEGEIVEPTKATE